MKRFLSVCLFLSFILVGCAAPKTTALYKQDYEIFKQEVTLTFQDRELVGVVYEELYNDSEQAGIALGNYSNNNELYREVKATQEDKGVTYELTKKKQNELFGGMNQKEIDTYFLSIGYTEVKTPK